MTAKDRCTTKLAQLMTIPMLGLKTKIFSMLLKVEDLEYEEGQWEEMLTRVQLKLGRTEIEMNSIISAL